MTTSVRADQSHRRSNGTPQRKPATPGLMFQSRSTSVLAACMAVAAYTGAVGLLGNDHLFGALQGQVHDRLPFHSFVFAAAALTVVVGLPMTWATVSAWSGTGNSGVAVIVAGVCLIGWILVELVLVRTYFWLQPACLAYGLVLVALGIHLHRSGQPRTDEA
jgi:hypothetical protein